MRRGSFLPTEVNAAYYRGISATELYFFLQQRCQKRRKPQNVCWPWDTGMRKIPEPGRLFIVANYVESMSWCYFSFKTPPENYFFFSATHCFDKKGAEKKKMSSASALSKCVIRSLDQNWITIAPSSWRQQTCRSSLWNLVDTFVLSAGVAALHKLRSSQCNVPHAELFFPLRASSRQTEGLSQEKLCFR